jgi:hypothetical protein
MSFFYGVNSSTPSNSPSLSPSDKTVLPGHNFKNGFMTGTIVIVVVTMISIVAIGLINRRVPFILEPPKEVVKGKPRKIHLTDFTGGLCFWYMLYLIFELIIRICVELRLKVPYAFVAIEIPSRFFLMIADLLLLFSLGWDVDEIIRGRLSLKNDWLSYISRPFAMIGGFAILLVFFGERIAYIVMMYGYGFRWDRPDKMYYAITRTAYAGGYLLLAVMLWVRFIRFYVVYRRRVSSGFFNDRCGKIPLLLATIMGPMITIRAIPAFCFTFFYRLMKKRQNPDLEILRIALLCIPLIIILCTFILLRKEDTAIKMKELAPVQYHSDPNLVQDYGRRTGQPGDFVPLMAHQKH